jgi:hypothetical protein
MLLCLSRRQAAISEKYLELDLFSRCGTLARVIVGADELVYLVHESGAVYAAAIRDDAIIAATEALDEDDALDPASLEDREYFDDVGAMLAQAYEGGAAAVITARFTVDA